MSFLPKHWRNFFDEGLFHAENRRLFMAHPEAQEGREQEARTNEGLGKYTSSKMEKASMLNDAGEVEELKGPDSHELVGAHMDNLIRWYQRSVMTDYDPEYLRENFERLRQATEAGQRELEQQEIQAIREKFNIPEPSSIIQSPDDNRDEAFRSAENVKKYFIEQYGRDELMLQGNIREHINRRLETLKGRSKQVRETFPQLKESDEFTKRIVSNIENIENDTLSSLKKSFDQLNFENMQAMLSENATGVKWEFNDAKQHYIAQHDLSDESKIPAEVRTELLNNSIRQALGTIYQSIQSEFDSLERRMGAAELYLDSIEQFVKDDPFKVLINAAELQNNEKGQDIIRSLLGEEEEVEAQKLSGDSLALAAHYAANKEVLREKLSEMDLSDEEKEKKVDQLSEINQEAEAEKSPEDIESLYGDIEQLQGDIKSMVEIQGFPKGFYESDIRKMRMEMGEMNSHIQRGRWEMEVYKKHQANLSPEMRKGLQRRFKDASVMKQSLMDQKESIKDIVFATLRTGSKQEWRRASLYSFWMAFTEYIEVFVSDYAREDKMSSAVIQRNAAGILKHGPSHLGAKSAKIEEMAAVNIEKIEAEERQKWEYDNHDNPSLVKELEEIDDNDVHHLRALLEKMAENGIIRWDSEILWRQLEKFTHIRIPKAARNDDRLRDMMLEQMFIDIFDDQDWFKEMKEKNMSGFIDAYKKRRVDADKFEAEALTHMKFSQILEKHYQIAGKDLNEYGQIDVDGKDYTPHYFDNADVDPHLFASMLIKMITEQGITPEGKIFYLVRGVASGLIPLEFLTHVEAENFFNTWPDLNVFRKISLKRICEIDRGLTGYNECNLDTKDKYFFKGDDETIVRYLHNEFPINGGVQDRVGRVIEKWRETDKDIQQLDVHQVIPSDMKELVKLASGNPKISSSGRMNAIMGWSTRLASFDIYDRNGYTDRKVEKMSAMKNSLASFVYFDSALRKRGVKSDIELSDDGYEKIPGMGGDAGLKTVEYANVTRNFLKAFLQEVGYANTHVLFNDNYAGTGPDKDAKLKEQGAIINTFVDKDFNAIMAVPENQEKLQYLIEKWQAQEAFAMYVSGGAKNSRSSGATREYGELLKLPSHLSFDTTEFSQWKEQGGNGKKFLENKYKNHTPTGLSSGSTTKIDAGASANDDEHHMAA